MSSAPNVIWDAQPAAPQVKWDESEKKTTQPGFLARLRAAVTPAPEKRVLDSGENPMLGTVPGGKVPLREGLSEADALSNVAAMGMGGESPMGAPPGKLPTPTGALDVLTDAYELGRGAVRNVGTLASKAAREPGKFPAIGPPTRGTLKPWAKMGVGPANISRIMDVVIPAREPIVQPISHSPNYAAIRAARAPAGKVAPVPELGSPENPGWVAKLPDRMTPAAKPTPELGSPENPGWVAKLPDRMPVGKTAPAPVDPVLQAVREGRAAKLPTRMPVGKTEPAPKPSMVAGTPTNAPSTFTAPLPETEPIGKTATTSSAAPTAEATPPTVRTAAEARAAARPELIKGSIANPSGRLILTPEEAATEARMLEIAKTRAQQHGLQYAAGMRPAGGGRVPATPTGVTIGDRGMQLNEPIGKTAARIFTSEGAEAPTTQASAPATPKAPAERTPLTEAQRNEIQGQIKNLDIRARALRDKQSSARVWTKANEYMRAQRDAEQQIDALKKSLEEDRPVKPKN